VSIRVVIAEDQAMVLGALAALLDMEGDIHVVSQVRNGREALQAVLAERPEVVITDIEMPAMTGIELAAALKGRSTAKVIVVTTFARPGYLRRALDAGAKGYLLKDRPSAELADAVRRVHRGLRVIDPDLAAAALAEGASPLTPRERDVLGASASNDGATLAEIAAAVRRGKPDIVFGNEGEQVTVNVGKAEIPGCSHALHPTGRRSATHAERRRPR